MRISVGLLPILSEICLRTAAAADRSLGPAASSRRSPAALASDGGPAGCSGQPTPVQTEGPYFKPGSPARASLVEAGMAGTRLTLTGRVLTRTCQPVNGARLDFWQADASGSY